MPSTSSPASPERTYPDCRFGRKAIVRAGADPASALLRWPASVLRGIQARRTDGSQQMAYTAAPVRGSSGSSLESPKRWSGPCSNREGPERMAQPRCRHAKHVARSTLPRRMAAPLPESAVSAVTAEGPARLRAPSRPGSPLQASRQVGVAIPHAQDHERQHVDAELHELVWKSRLEIPVHRPRQRYAFLLAPGYGHAARPSPGTGQPPRPPPSRPPQYEDAAEGLVAVGETFATGRLPSALDDRHRFSGARRP